MKKLTYQMQVNSSAYGGNGEVLYVYIHTYKKIRLPSLKRSRFFSLCNFIIGDEKQDGFFCYVRITKGYQNNKNF